MAEREPRPEPSRTHSAGSDSSVGPSPPPPPAPENDDLLGYLHPSADHVSSPTLAAQVDDVFKIAPQAALKLLSAGIEALVSMTGDHLPPTPPQQSPTLPHMRAMEAEKKSIVRSNSEKSLARLAAQQRGSTPTTPLAGRSPAPPPPPPPPQPEDQPIDGVHLRPQSPLPHQHHQPTQHQHPLPPHTVVGENSQPLNLQHAAISRKFYCRVPPPISITDYLLRIHQYCPLSTAVYVAASLYIHRLAVLERAIVVTQRNAHRLLLAGLRVAVKALEDLTYPHSRFARVGGVSPRELSRLEVSFCFLTGFELAVNAEVLGRHWGMVRRGPRRGMCMSMSMSLWEGMRWCSSKMGVGAQEGEDVGSYVQLPVRDQRGRAVCGDVEAVA